MFGKKNKEPKPKKLYLVDKKKKSGIISSLTSSHVDVYENFYNELVKVPWTDPIDIIITTNGGSCLLCSKICYVLKNRKGKSRVFVKSHAHSAGTVIALTANELYITMDTTFSAIDAQGFPFSDVLQTSMQRIAKLVQDPKNAFVEISNERANYFRTIIEKYLNSDLHNKHSIMEFMHDKSPIHEQLFFREDMDRIGIKYKIWDGNDESTDKIKEKTKEDKSIENKSTEVICV